MASLHRGWRYLLWAIAILCLTVGLYALAGFVAAPYWMQSRLWPMLSEQFGGQFHAERTEFNPFRLSLKVGGVSLKTPDGKELGTIGEIGFDVDVSASLHERKLIASAILSKPSVNIAFDHQGRPNYAFLIPKQKGSSGKAFPFLLTGLKLQQGRLAFEDHSKGAGYKQVLSQVEFDLANLALPSRTPARFKLEAMGEDKEKLAAWGEYGLEKTELTGELKLERLALAPIVSWLAEGQDFKPDGRLSLKLKYRYQGDDFQVEAGEAELSSFSLERQGQPFLAANKISAQGFAYNHPLITLKSLGSEGIELETPMPIMDEDGKPRHGGIPKLGMDGLSVDLKDQTANVGQISSQGAVLAFWLEQDGSLGLPGLLPGFKQNVEHKEAKDSSTWKVGLERIELNECDIALRDFTSDPPAAMRLSPLNLLIKNYSSDPSKTFWLGMNTGLSMNGRIATEGEIRLKPLTANFKLYIDDLSLPAFQPYVDKAAKVRLVKGALNLNADIDYDDEAEHKLRLGGDVAIADLDADDKLEGKDFMSWKNLRLNGVIFDSAPKPRLSIREIIASQPYARAFLDPEGKFNIAEVLSPPVDSPPMKPAAASKTSKATNAAKPNQDGPDDGELAVVIGTFHIHEGQADFADMTIKPTGFSADIHELNGDIKSLSSRRDSRSDVLLAGRLNEGSPVSIQGKINPFSASAFTDIKMSFREVNMTALSPYSGKFAGYRIEKGKLNMDLHYRLDNGQLQADNKFVLDHLELGERVDSPSATSLPVRLAVSLLKDGDGKIDVSLPISGDLGNPDVSIRGLLANAATEMITKLVTSPFTILGNLMGGGSEDMDAVKFAPGASSLDSQEKSKLASIAKALEARPELNLDIKGTADKAMDAPLLAEQGLDRQLKNTRLIELGMTKATNPQRDEVTLTDDQYSRLLTEFYRSRNPNAEELLNLKSGSAMTGKTMENARHKILEQWPVSEMDLRGLAQARAESIRNYLVKEMGLPDQRIYLLDVKLSDKEEKEIKALLSLDGS